MDNKSHVSSLKRGDDPIPVLQIKQDIDEDNRPGEEDNRLVEVRERGMAAWTSGDWIIAGLLLPS